MSELFERIQKNFNRQPVIASLGAKLEVVEAGHCEISMKKQDHMLQQVGFLHAGVSATLIDSACGYAALSTMPEGSDVLSIEFKVNNLRPAAGEHFIAKADVIKAGKHIIVTEGTLFEVGSDKPIVRMVCTIFPVYEQN